MISQLRGILAEATPGSVVLDVGGVGFELGVSLLTASSLPPLGSECTLYARLQVREDAMTLFGFASKDERTMFDKLVAISGVGPRLALAVLSKFSIAQLHAIVISDDVASLSTVPGVGKKTAQRLILELKSVFAKNRELAHVDSSLVTQLPLQPAASADAVMEDVRAALLSMGFSSQESDLALGGVDAEGKRVEELLAAALKRLGMEA